MRFALISKATVKIVVRSNFITNCLSHQITIDNELKVGKAQKCSLLYIPNNVSTGYSDRDRQEGRGQSTRYNIDPPAFGGLPRSL